MLLKITNYCAEGCLHCSQDSTPNGKHVESEVIDNFIMFVKKCTIPSIKKQIVIGGGEPTNNPDWFKIIERLKKELPDFKFILATNGVNFVNDKNTRNKILTAIVNYDLEVQITSVRKLYKNAEIVIPGVHDILKKSPKHVKNNIHLITSFEYGILPVGRAANNIANEFIRNNLRSNSKATGCFNLYNIFQKHTKDIYEGIKLIKIHSNTSFCKPTIRENGDVVFGEYINCHAVSNLRDLLINPEITTSNVLGPCGSCVTSAEQKFNILTYITEYKDTLRNIKEEK